MFKNLMAAGAFAGVFGLMIGMPSADAMPIGRVDSGDAQLIRVSGGCGPYWHRGPYGGCQPGGQLGDPPGRGPVGYIPGPFGGRFCPPGYHLGQYGGACWPN